MKVLFLHPHLDSNDSSVQMMQRAGYDVLFTRSIEEAKRCVQLHGSSLFLIIVHREDRSGSKSTGAEFVRYFQSKTQTQSTPYLLTSEQWDEAEFVIDQRKKAGANAYLRFPFSPEILVETVEKVIGKPRKKLSAVPAPLRSAVSLEAAQEFKFSEARQPVLEPAEIELQEIRLEQPTLSLEGLPKARPSDIHLRLEATKKIDAVDLSNQEEEPSLDVHGFDLAPESGPKTPARAAAPLRSPADVRAVSVDPFLQPFANAVIPGGVGNTLDIDTLKQYLLLREQDVALLGAELERERIRADEQELLAKSLQQEKSNWDREQKERDRENQKLKIELETAEKSREEELSDQKSRYERRLDKAKVLEAEVRSASEELNQLKERVRVDLRRIRIREKELESKLELARKDAQHQVSLREQKITEFRRKVDILEFNLDAVQEKLQKSLEENQRLRRRLGDVSRAFKDAEDLLIVPELRVQSS